MFANSQPNVKVDVIEILLSQNLYERLGLKTNRVSFGQIHTAYNARLNLLHNCRQELTEEEAAQAESMIDAAYAELSDRSRRTNYDSQLTGEYPVSAELVGSGEPASTLLLDRYRIEQQIAEGQRCLVYSAWDSRLGRQVIVKRVRPELANEGSHRLLFQQEAELFARSNASNLVKILDYDVSTCAVVSERMAYDLAESIKAGPVGPTRLREILRDALAGLAALHREGIAHGRVELQHLFADDDGGIKLAVAPGMTGSQSTLRPSKDSRHIAPELLNATSYGQPSLASDIYALGFVCLELLCGNKLASRVSATMDDSEQVANNWLVWHASPTEQLPPIAELIPDLPVDLCSLLERMTRKQQHERFTDARACLEAMSYVPATEQIQTYAVPLGSSSDAGVEIYGSPPHLHAIYDAPKRLSWSDIAKNPALLLAPEARSHLTQVGLATLMLLSGLFLVFQPERIKKQTAQVEEAATEIQSLEDFEVAAPSTERVTRPTDDAAATQINKVDGQPSQQTSQTAVRVTLEVLPSGRVLQIGEQTATTDNQNEWLLPAGVYTARCLDTESSVEFETTFSVPADVEYAYFAIPVPVVAPEQPILQPPYDPYADVRGMSFQPSIVPFDIQGASDAEHATQQRSYLVSALRNIVQSPHHRRKDMPFAVSSKPVDPRATFTLALWAFREGNLDRAVDLCRESLRAAEHYHIPFLLPLRMLNHLQIDHGKGGLQAALGECRLVLSWLNQMDSLRPSLAIKHAQDELAWWTGLLVGFTNDVPHGLANQILDTDSLEAVIRSSSSANQWKTFRIGRLAVINRYALINRHWSEVSAEKSKLQLSENEEAQLPLISHTYSADDHSKRRPSLGQSGATIGMSSASASASRRFVSYRPFDIPGIAIEVLSTLNKPSESGLALR